MNLQFDRKMMMTKRMSSKNSRFRKNSFLMQKAGWWMRSSCSSLNRHRDAKEKLAGLKMSFSLKTEADISNLCSQRSLIYYF
jgi:hypothetical protein